MIMNEMAIYMGKPWCSYELKDKNGNYIEELRISMRAQSQKNRFRCPDCGEPFILCAGPIMEPYFKHYDESQCINHSKTAGKNYQKARRLLYHLAKRSFPDAEIEFNVKIGSVIADLLIRVSSGELVVVELQGQNVKIEDWMEKHSVYEQNGIAELWIMNSPRINDVNLTTTQYLMTRASKIIKLLDVKEERIRLLKLREDRYRSSCRYISKEYSLSDVTIQTNGEIDCDFEQYNRSCSGERMLSAEPVLEESVLEYTINDEQVVDWEVEDYAVEHPIIEHHEHLQSEKSVISADTLRIPYSSDLVSNKTMKMTALNELWLLPELQGTEWQIKKANALRYEYLKNVNSQLKSMEDNKAELIVESQENSKAELIESSAGMVKNRLKASQW